MQPASRLSRSGTTINKASGNKKDVGEYPPRLSLQSGLRIAPR